MDAVLKPQQFQPLGRSRERQPSSGPPQIKDVVMMAPQPSTDPQGKDDLRKKK